MTIRKENKRLGRKSRRNEKRDKNNTTSRNKLTKKNKETPRQTKRINVLKEKYKDVETLGPQDIGNFTLVQHEIHLTDQVPTIAKYSTKSPEVNEWIEEQVKKYLEYGAIEPSVSQYSANVVPVAKKDGEGKGLDRFCINYGMLNNKTITTKYPIPSVDEILDEMGECTYFTNFDISQAYWQTKIKPLYCI